MTKEEGKKYENIMPAPEIRLSRHAEEISIPSFPESIRLYLDSYHKGDFSFSGRHWHHSIQFNVILEGTLDASINGEDVVLKKGDGIFINSDVFHCTNPRGKSDCECYSFQVPPSALCSERDVVLYGKYITPVISCEQFPYMVLNQTEEKSAEILQCLEHAFNTMESGEATCELKVKRELLSVWIVLLDIFGVRNKAGQENPAAASASGERMKAMLSYVRQHYRDKITLGDIAGSANVSISECSRCFRKFLNTTPMEYVSQVRIAAACRMFETTNEKPASVSDFTGFTDHTYFYRVFRKYMGCTPKEYQKRIRGEEV